MACSRLAAWRHTTLWGPSTTAALISSPRWAGRQWSTTASGAGRGQQRLVDLVAGEGGQASLLLVLLAHRGPHVGVEGVGPGRRLGRVVGHLRSPPKERTRATSSSDGP